MKLGNNLACICVFYGWEASSVSGEIWRLNRIVKLWLSFWDGRAELDMFLLGSWQLFKKWKHLFTCHMSTKCKYPLYFRAVNFFTTRWPNCGDFLPLKLKNHHPGTKIIENEGWKNSAASSFCGFCRTLAAKLSIDFAYDNNRYQSITTETTALGLLDSARSCQLCQLIISSDCGVWGNKTYKSTHCSLSASVDTANANAN